MTLKEGVTCSPKPDQALLQPDCRSFNSLVFHYGLFSVDLWGIQRQEWSVKKQVKLGNSDMLK